MLPLIDPGNVSVEIRNSIAVVEFYHPGKNSLPGELLHKLTSEIENLSSASGVNVIVLRSGGEGPFCAGASFDQLLLIHLLLKVLM